MTDFMTAPSLSRLKGIRHGFSTGVKGNLSNHAGAGLGFAPDRLVTLRQVHGKQAFYVQKPWQDSVPEGDALVTDVPGLALGLYTADCAPVLMAEPRAGLIAAAHAGWRGACAGVLEAILEKITAKGGHLAHLYTAIGPAIAQENYEVGEDFYQNFLKDDSAHERFFKAVKNPPLKGSGLYFDLKAYCAWRLHKAGVGHIEILPYDTYALEDMFFSYRRARQNTLDTKGRQMSIIVLS